MNVAPKKKPSYRDLARAIDGAYKVLQVREKREIYLLAELRKLAPEHEVFTVLNKGKDGFTMPKTLKLTKAMVLCGLTDPATCSKRIVLDNSELTVCNRKREPNMSVCRAAIPITVTLNVAGEDEAQTDETAQPGQAEPPAAPPAGKPEEPAPPAS